MDSSSDDHIARLLRLKRYEQPPPGYFENFLYEFRQRRRRDELFRQPFWSSCVERVRDFVFWHNLRPLASLGAAAIVVGTAALSIIVHPQPNTTQLAVLTSPIPIAPPIMDKQLDFERAGFDMQASLLPGSADLLVLPASDEFIPLNLEWDSLDDGLLVEK